MTLIFSLIYWGPIVPRFLSYYTGSTDHFVCLLHTPSLRPKVEAALAGQRCTIQDMEPSVFTAQRDADEHDAARKKYVSVDEWYSVLDVDEFHFHPQYRTLRAMQKAAEAVGSEYVPGQFVDRIAGDGTIPIAVTDAALDSQFPLAADLTKVVLQGATSKVVMARAHVPVTLGHHGGVGKRAPFVCEVHHFKWLGGDLLERLSQRAVDFKKLAHAQEGQRFVDHYTQHQRINLEDPALGVRPAACIGA